MPTWIDFGAEIYGLPDLEGRGFKVAPDRHGGPIDPDTDERLVAAESVQRVRAFLARRFPALAAAPLLETRVCQYENTSNGDFLIDRHPDADNVWLVGGGSGHGFKHGPAVGEYVAERLAGGGPEEPRFSLATKETVRKRAVY
jgi:glycine/D-amino acid oxidase-like deaminating enzyme